MVKFQVKTFPESEWKYSGGKWHHLKWGTTTITNEITWLKVAQSDYMVIMQ
jgi:hypothetical protein